MSLPPVSLHWVDYWTRALSTWRVLKQVIKVQFARVGANHFVYHLQPKKKKRIKRIHRSWVTIPFSTDWSFGLLGVMGRAWGFIFILFIYFFVLFRHSSNLIFTSLFALVYREDESCVPGSSYWRAIPPPLLSRDRRLYIPRQYATLSFTSFFFQQLHMVIAGWQSNQWKSNISNNLYNATLKMGWHSCINCRASVSYAVEKRGLEIIEYIACQIGSPIKIHDIPNRLW